MADRSKARLQKLMSQLSDEDVDKAIAQIMTSSKVVEPLWGSLHEAFTRMDGKLALDVSLALLSSITGYTVAKIPGGRKALLVHLPALVEMVEDDVR